jgi:anaerobic ribonucleoside-triphosphate reductase activating protein
MAAKAKDPRLEGISLIGGEPFEQDAGLAELSGRVRAAGLSVMAYTGYTLEELRERGSVLVGEVDLLVDGRYREELRTTTRRFIGSTNQVLHFLSGFYTEDDPRFAEPNTAEIRFDHRGQIQVVGFPFDSVAAAFGPLANRKDRGGVTRSPSGAWTW